MRRAGVPLEAHFAAFGDRPTFADVLPLARLITDDFLAGTYSRVDIVYSRFVSTLVQRPELDSLLPIEPSEDTEGIPGNQFIFEPNAAAVLEQLLPRYVATRLFQAVLEAKASEESSRMVAMKNATENAEDLIEDLTLSYNKVRQSNITREMIEIATGARRPLTLDEDAGGQPPMATATRDRDRPGHPDHRPRRRHRVPGRPAAGHLQRGRDRPRRGRSRSSARSSSTSATTGSARSR